MANAFRGRGGHERPGNAELLRTARHVVYPSSDKSVQPPSCTAPPSGSAKVCADAPHASIVRYVNVIGTRGSVIEVFPPGPGRSAIECD
jgi:FlaA1/EpsC-like NDP-sugar epimerase